MTLQQALNRINAPIPTEEIAAFRTRKEARLRQILDNPDFGSILDARADANLMDSEIEDRIRMARRDTVYHESAEYRRYAGHVS